VAKISLHCVLSGLMDMSKLAKEATLLFLLAVSERESEGFATGDFFCLSHDILRASALRNLMA